VQHFNHALHTLQVDTGNVRHPEGEGFNEQGANLLARIALKVVKGFQEDLLDAA
jgi:hypothetical protein